MNKKLTLEIKKMSNIVKDRGAKIAQIKILLEGIIFEVNFKLLVEYPSNVLEFSRNSSQWLLNLHITDTQMIRKKELKKRMK